MAREDEQRERDIYMLDELDSVDVDAAAEYGTADVITEREHEAFTDMREALRKFAVLTERQRSWATQVAGRLGLNITPPRLRKPVPRGAEVAIAPVLRVLPKRPPGARR